MTVWGSALDRLRNLTRGVFASESGAAAVGEWGSGAESGVDAAFFAARVPKVGQGSGRRSGCVRCFEGEAAKFAHTRREKGRFSPAG